MTRAFQQATRADYSKPRPGRVKWFRPGFESLESRCLLSITSAVVGRHIFYDNSKFDGNTPGVNAAGDDAAIATDKSALLGDLSLASPANVTSYSRGINGIAVDITGSHPGITQSDLLFKVGNNNAPGSWALAPAPSDFSVVPGGGVGGADRVEITWADNAIENTYLQVVVAANDNTGLATSDAFFFGNRIGDDFLATPPLTFNTTAADEIDARNNPGFLQPLTNIYDYNKDSLVSAADQIIARNNAGFMFKIGVQVSPPALAADLAVDTGPDGTPNTDGITADPTIQGTLTAATSIASFNAGLNGAPVTTDALGQLTGSAFTLDETFLETLNGGPLADGAYVVHLQTVDADGYGAAVEVAFTLKTSITPPTIPDLISADDSGTSSTDDITNVNTPRIDVNAETGSLVRIYVDGSPVDTGTGAPGLQFTLSTLTDGVHNIHVVSQDGAGNSATSPTLPITISTALPTISIATIASISADLTPHVTIAASGPLGLANGTQVTVDVDLNYDNDYGDSGETARTTSTLFNGGSYFQVTPALPHDVAGSAYNVQLRARVTDIAGNEGVSSPQLLKIDSIGNTVLEDYVTAFDPTYGYSLDSTVGGAGFTMYNIDMDSQTWRSLADVNKPVWQHWVQVYVPSGTVGNTATLFIDGGSTSGSPPSVDSGLGALAAATGSVLVRLRTVPNQPLIFTGDPGNMRTEDEIIAYTFDQYANNLGNPGNETWPALLPMVKSAVAAMDMTQDFVPTVVSGGAINDFVVTGYSKRGWTTWLSAATDDRVRAIIPGVIDVLNMGEQMVHHYGVYTGFAPAIHDYTDFDIPQESYTVGGQEIGRVVDPYSYLDNGRFDDLPKLLINSPGDEFFVSDSAQFYFDDIPGTQNYLRYIPNTGHGLNSTDPVNSTWTFFDAVVNGTTLPQFSWTVGQDGSINLQTVSTPVSGGVKLWQATNPSARDFRNFPVNPTWTSSTLVDQGGGSYSGNVATPGSGATAYFVEMTFDNPVPGLPDFVFTTEVRVATNIPLTPWAFFMPAIPPPSAPLASQGGAGGSGADPTNVDAVAVALAEPAANDASAAALQPLLVGPGEADSPVTADDVDLALASNWSWTEEDDEPLADGESDELALMLLDDDWR